MLARQSSALLRGQPMIDLNIRLCVLSNPNNCGCVSGMVTKPNFSRGDHCIKHLQPESDGHIFVQQDRLVLVEPTPRRLNTRSKVNSAPLRHITTEFPPLVLVGVTVGQHFNPSISNFDMLRHGFVAVSCQQFRF